MSSGTYKFCIQMKNTLFLLVYLTCFREVQFVLKPTYLYLPPPPPHISLSVYHVMALSY